MMEPQLSPELLSQWLINEQETNRKLRAEIKRLEFLNQEERQTIEDLSKLCTRAADALSKGPFHPQYKLDLAKELRKAAQ